VKEIIAIQKILYVGPDGNIYERTLTVIIDIPVLIEEAEERETHHCID
jgi:hypothetical protein